MSRTVPHVALITGANSGIGREIARQLALSSRYSTVVLACRDLDKGRRASAQLASETGSRAFEVMPIDLANSADVRRFVQSLPFAVDDLILNAGGSGGKRPMALTTDGVTQIFASNVLGHAVLTTELIESGKLRRGALYLGSEAARGVRLLGIERPTLPSHSVDEFMSICDGSIFDGAPVDGRLAYAQVKWVAALWMSALARRHPGLKLLTVSPGNTSGTEIGRDFPLPQRWVMKYLFMPIIAPLLGAVHDVGHGAARIVNALTDPPLASGGFYASQPKAVIGPLAEQGEFFPELADWRIQDNAAAAIDRFIRPSLRPGELAGGRPATARQPGACRASAGTRA